MFDVILEWIRNPDNRDLADWSLKFLGGLGAALAAVWLFFRGPSKPPKARAPGASSQQIASGNRLSYVTVRLVRNSTWIFLIFAGFAAFALLQVRGAETPRTSQRACAPELTLPAHPVEASVLLHNRGIDHAERGDYPKAKACFEAALSYHANSEEHLRSLFRLHRVWSEGDREEMYRISDRRIALAKSKLADISISPAVAHLPCEERNRFTGEVVSTSPWHSKALLFHQDGDIAAARATLQDLMDSYPRKSCVYNGVIGNAHVTAALIFCNSGQPGAAADAYRKSLATRSWSKAHLQEFQQIMADAGVYKGAIDGVIGDTSDAALSAWAELGCPGVAFDP